MTFVLGGGATSFWWIARGTVLRRGGGSRPGTSWIARSSSISTVLVSLLLRSLREGYCHELGLFSLSLSLFLSLSPGPCLSILPHLFIVAISACAASLSHLFSLLSHYFLSTSSVCFPLFFVGLFHVYVSHACVLCYLHEHLPCLVLLNQV